MLPQPRTPYHAKKNKRQVTHDHDDEMAYQDEKLDVDKLDVDKLDVDEQGAANEVSARDAALTRRILLKLDIRYDLSHVSLSSS